MMKKTRLTTFCQNVMLKMKISSGLVKITFAILILNGSMAVAQIGVHTDFPDASSAMDIYATNKGLLIPRLVLTGNLSDPSPVTSPATGLLVFNIGTNQAPGFYYWSGLNWVPVSGGSSSGSFWGLSGNIGTIPGTNYLGTADNNHFLIYTNNTERMRFENDGQVIIGGTAPNNPTDLFTVFGNSTQNAAINAYSPRIGYQTVGGRYGILSTVDTANGFSYYGRNLDPLGYGLISVGSNFTSVIVIGSGRSAGIHSQGYDGLHAWGKSVNGYGIFARDSNATTTFNLAGITAGLSASGKYGIIAKGLLSNGRGIVAVGSNAAVSVSNECEGGAFTGFHGVYGKGVGYQTTPLLIAGIGVIGVGYNQTSYTSLPDGTSLGGSFTGDYGAYGKGLSATGVGIVGVGSNGGGYFTITGGSGGTFAGYHGLLSVGVNTNGTGVTAAGNNGSYVILPAGAGGVFSGSSTGTAGFGMSPTSGIGVIGGGNNSAVWVPSNGCGGAFTGNTGILTRSTNNTGTGIVSFGNNLVSPNTYANGCGGAFTGTEAGIVGWGTTVATGIGVIGAGNNVAPVLPSPNTGTGGAFTGAACGVYGYATNTTNANRYGGYFATSGAYAYVGVRYNNTNRKILGTNSVSTIVKNTKGDLVILTCPEAPENVFQDFGIGQLINGRAHITIDPDLAININISENHPLKVYITPEGDCKGVYVTNKTANGFDVIELQGGTSNIPFSWQIVATRANEEYVTRDGRIEFSDNSTRFPPAPGPLDFTEHPPVIIQGTILETAQEDMTITTTEHFKKDQNIKGTSIEVKQDEVIEVTDDLRE